jgi:hypothetical protein
MGWGREHDMRWSRSHTLSTIRTTGSMGQVLVKISAARPAGALTGGSIEQDSVSHSDHDLEPSAEARPRYRRNLRRSYEATTLAHRAKQARDGHKYGGTHPRISA